MRVLVHFPNETAFLINFREEELYIDYEFITLRMGVCLVKIVELFEDKSEMWVEHSKDLHIPMDRY